VEDVDDDGSSESSLVSYREEARLRGCPIKVPDDREQPPLKVITVTKCLPFVGNAVQ
jgi:hypothetical protein